MRLGHDIGIEIANPLRCYAETDSKFSSAPRNCLGNIGGFCIAPSTSGTDKFIGLVEYEANDWIDNAIESPALIEFMPEIVRKLSQGVRVMGLDDPERMTSAIV